MTKEQQQIIDQLRDQGYAISIFTPEEIGEIRADLIEDAMVIAGNHALDQFKSHF